MAEYEAILHLSYHGTLVALIMSKPKSGLQGKKILGNGQLNSYRWVFLLSVG